MERFLSILGCITLAAVVFAFGFFTGRGRADVRGTETVTLSDTVWVETHDTAWVETAVNISRIDTVRLAQVVGAENAHTTHDTLFVHDSVFVEVPIEQKTFLGDHYRITAHGYMVGLDDVWFDRQVITNTVTQTKYMNKRWRFNVGAQIGYGYTVHGASPYAGIGVAFGYTF